MTAPRIILAGPEPMTETLIWRDAESDPPDADITVLLAFDPALGLDIELGFFGDGWHCAEYDADSPAVPRWWAEMPKGPR